MCFFKRERGEKMLRVLRVEAARERIKAFCREREEGREKWVVLIRTSKHCLYTNPNTNTWTIAILV